MNLWVAPLNLSVRLLRSHGNINWPLAIAIASVAIVQAVAAAAASWVEGAWFLPGSKGFSQHYGAWAILITDPLLLAATGFLDRHFLVTMTTLPLCSGRDSRRTMWQLLHRYVPFVRGKGPSAFLYLLMVVVGLYCWAKNVQGTFDPTGADRYVIFDHHDVFDSGNHPWSFVIFKVCLFVSWVVIYPIVGFKFLTVAISTRAILRAADLNGILCPRVEHPDCCYGLKNVGTLNIALLAPYVLVFIAIFSLLLTHNIIYDSLKIPLIAVSLMFIATSYVVIRPVYSILSRSRRKIYEELAETSLEDSSSSQRRLHAFTSKRLLFSVANATPYTDGTKWIIAAMRATSAVIAGLGTYGYLMDEFSQPNVTEQQGHVTKNVPVREERRR